MKTVNSKAKPVIRLNFSLLVILLVLAAACMPIVIAPTPIVLTVVPPPTPLPPTPTREMLDEQWYLGCDITPHCDSTHGMIEVNPNPGLDAGVARIDTDFTMMYLLGTPYTREVEVAYPLPDRFYRWDANGQAQDGWRIFEGAMPAITEYRRNDNIGFSVNVSGWSGELLLTNVVQTIYASPGWYAIGLEVIPVELHTYDPALARDPNIMSKRCTIYADNGMTYPLPDQSFEVEGWEGWEDTIPQDFVYALHVTRDITISLSCGIIIHHASLDGQIVFDRFHITAVEPGWGRDTALTIP